MAYAPRPLNVIKRWIKFFARRAEHWKVRLILPLYDDEVWDLKPFTLSPEATAKLEDMEITDAVPMDVDEDAPMDVDKNTAWIDGDEGDGNWGVRYHILYWSGVRYEQHERF